MGTNLISLSYIFTNLWVHDFKNGFKDEDVDAWQPSYIIKASQSTRQSRNKLWVTLTLGLHYHSIPVCLLNGLLGIFTLKFLSRFFFFNQPTLHLGDKGIKSGIYMDTKLSTIL